MKNTYILLLLMLFAISAKSQETRYIGSAQKLMPYVGTWRYTNGQEVFEFTFNNPVQESETWNNITWISTSIEGFHTYKNSSGILIENPAIMVYQGVNYYTVRAGIVNLAKGLDIGFTDITKGKGGKAYLKFLPNSTTQAIWTLNEYEGLKSGPTGSVYPLGWSVPTGPITMTKVN